jgi:hypothetical protein
MLGPWPPDLYGTPLTGPLLSGPRTQGSAATGGRQDTLAGVLEAMLLLPDSFEPAYRTKQYNSAVLRAVADKEVQVRGPGQLGEGGGATVGAVVRAMLGGSCRCRHLAGPGGLYVGARAVVRAVVQELWYGPCWEVPAGASTWLGLEGSALVQGAVGNPPEWGGQGVPPFLVTAHRPRLQVPAQGSRAALQ